MLTCTLFSKDSTACFWLQCRAVVAGSDDFVVVAEFHASLFENSLDVACTRSNDDLAAFAHPYCGLVGALEAVYGVVGMVVGCDRDVVLAGLSNPTGHGEWRGCGWDHPA